MITRNIDLRDKHPVKLSEEGREKLGPKFPAHAETIGMRDGLVSVLDRDTKKVEEYHPDFLELVCVRPIVGGSIHFPHKRRMYEKVELA